MATEINIGAFLGTRAFLNPDKEALYDVASDRRFTFSQLNARANQACAALSALGLARGDRVALLAYNGSEFVECFFGPAKAGLVIMPLNWRLTESFLNGRYPRRLYDAGQAFPIDHPLGAAMLFRREAIEDTGGFDPDYHMYVEEIDWCMRVKHAGWEIYCVPGAEIVHYEGQSTRQVRPQMVVALWRSRFLLFERF